MSADVFATVYQKTVHAPNGIKAIVFDLDGTLLDTLGDLTDAVNYALARHGMSVRTIDEIRKFVGNGALRLIERSVPDGQQNPAFEDVYEDFQKYYAAHCNIKTKAYPGVLALLAELKKRGVAMAVVSNKPDGAVKTLCEKYFGEYISVAMGDAPGRERKPAPDTVEAAMEAIGADPRQTIYVGDSEVDIRTAENAGLFHVLVTWGFREPEFLLANGAKRLIHSAEALLDYIS
ncbi:MAG: HAD-IA family hydrolase [Clostridiales bacterium]|nr:HAD-IA family hydrolase [Clostridiales bacterium]